jgi:hypothetical protein
MVLVSLPDCYAEVWELATAEAGADETGEADVGASNFTWIFWAPYSTNVQVAVWKRKKL